MKISKALRGRKGTFLGRKHSKETKEKMRKSMLAHIKKTGGFVNPIIGKNEKEILDRIEQRMSYKMIRQYKVAGYFIDGYIPELKIAIEIDERAKIREKDIEREGVIKQELNCQFVRIRDYSNA